MVALYQSNAQIVPTLSSIPQKKGKKSILNKLLGNITPVLTIQSVMIIGFSSTYTILNCT